MLSGYIDGSLGDAERAHVVARLESDPAFAARLERLQRNDTLVKTAYDLPMRDALPVRLLKRLTGASTARPPLRHERGSAHDHSNRGANCWFLPKSVAKPLARLCRKHSR
jgi:anti-sigma factor RsiW